MRSMAKSGVHDPSTVIVHAGRYYTYGTGNGLPILSRTMAGPGTARAR